MSALTTGSDTPRSRNVGSWAMGMVLSFCGEMRRGGASGEVLRARAHRKGEPGSETSRNDDVVPHR
jgi:hypothetical protein